MEQAVGTLLGLLMTALVFSVLARLAWRVGGCIGVPVSLFLWACWVVSLWNLLVTVGALLVRAGR